MDAYIWQGLILWGFLGFSSLGVTLRKLQIDTQEPTKYPTGELFAVSTTKLVLMTLGTAGLYSIYWFGMNWKAIDVREHRADSPVFKGILNVFYSVSLFGEFDTLAKAAGYTGSIHTRNWGVFLLLLTIGTGFITGPSPLFFLGALLAGLTGTIVSLRQVQRVVLYINRAHDPRYKPESHFSGRDLYILISGALSMVVLIVLFLALPMGMQSDLFGSISASVRAT